MRRERGKAAVLMNPVAANPSEEGMFSPELTSTRCLICHAGEVHVWRVALALNRKELSAVAAVLSSDEFDLGAGFTSEMLRCRWMAAHGALRMILAAYTDMAPADLCFIAEPTGKPKLVAADLSFNLTHTEGLAFIAITSRGLVGIDAEVVHPEFPWERIARTFFAPEEFRAIFQLAPELRTRAFYSCWTRKEAYLKALGFGFQAPLDDFQGAVGSDEPLLLHVDGDPDQAAQWGLVDISERGVAAAVATNPKKTVMRRFAFSVPPH
jgi:4'-phosphopantetheinyl transferase